MLIASRIDIMPRGIPSLLTTGRCRTLAFVILSTAVTMFSLGLAFRDVLDMMLVTGTPFPVRDFVTEKRTSRSVSIPTMTPALSTTMTLPMFPSHMADAASSIVAVLGHNRGRNLHQVFRLHAHLTGFGFWQGFHLLWFGHRLLIIRHRHVEICMSPILGRAFGLHYRFS